MSVHDRAAARNIPRFTLTTSRYSNGCLQTLEREGLTAREVENWKSHEIECWPWPELESPIGSYSLSFEVY